MADMAGRFGAEVVELKTEAGTSFSLDTLTAAVEKEKPAVLFLCQARQQGGAAEWGTAWAGGNVLAQACRSCMALQPAILSGGEAWRSCSLHPSCS